jgi:DNA-binding CsgD family transcriptional regulator
MDTRWDIARALYTLGRVEAQQDDLRAARSHYQESLELSRELGEKFMLSLSLEGLAGVLARQGEHRWAAQLWGAAESLREAIAVPLPPVDRPTYEQAVSVASMHLGESAFRTAWQEGRTMTPEQSLAAKAVSVTISVEPPVAPHPRSSSTYPASLTAREVEVLRLVAQGFTNAEVAAQLVVSPRTVNFHLTSIYSKIGVSSRNAATRYAIEQHLV